MKKILANMLFVGLALAMAGSAVAEPPEGGSPDRPPRRERGPRGDRPPRGPGRGGPQGPQGHPIMAALDADKDGTLSVGEIEKAADALRLLDKDGDGQLSRDELRPKRGERGERRRGPRGEGPDDDFGRGPKRGGPQGFQREGRRPRDFGPPDGDEARGPRVLPPGAHERLDLSDGQIAKIEALELEVKTRVEEILEPEQLERLALIFRRGPGGPGGRERFGGRAEGPPGPPDRPRGPRPPRE